MILFQLTANTGPAECCLAVRHALHALVKEANQRGVTVEVLEEQAGPVPETYGSILLGLLSGDANLAAHTLAQRWSGTLQWICDSPYRPGHKRKNWFIGGALHEPPAPLPDSEIRYDTMHASGPGGQHVNKTASAVRATHVATGVSVRVQSQRSQLANRQLAARLLAGKLQTLAARHVEAAKAQRRLQHGQTERGNARRTFVGQRFIEAQRGEGR
ncbi:MAG: peptide chain release factor H [Burkholderiaceae bacterium]|nr:peptide chain release factor H [Burkholderiaceae bacterium]